MKKLPQEEEQMSSLDVKEPEPETTTQIFISKINSTFFDNLPLEYIGTLPLGYAIVFGMVAYAVVLVALLCFTITGYNQIMKQQFISLDIDAGSCS